MTISRPTRSTRRCIASPPASSGWRRCRPTTAPSGGAPRIIKYRAQGFRGGYHDFVIRRGGAHIFPRLVAAEHRRDFKRGRIGSGIPGLDALLGGGVERGSSTLLIGPAGAGKSLIALQFVAQAIRDGGKAAMFIFDEELGLLFDRAKPLGFDLAALQAGGRLAHHPARRGGTVARGILA